MKIVPTGRVVSFTQVTRGATFRLSHEGKSLIAMKIFLMDTEAALVLTDGAMTLISAQELERNVVLELADVALMPSSDEKAVEQRPDYIAESGELLLKDGKVLLVFDSAGGRTCADVATGEVGASFDWPPIIVTEWSLVQTVLGKPTVIYTRKAPAIAKIA